MTRVYGVLGWPVAHSRSPAMQNAAFAACGIDATYVRFPVAPDALGDAIRGLRALGIAGANVTIPHKSTVLAHLDAIDESARAVGAANTLIFEEKGVVRGANTDVGGLVQALVEAGAKLSGAHAVVLGAGGAARAAVAGLQGAGARVTVAARRPEEGARLGAPTLALADREALAHALATADVVVQASSATMKGSATGHGGAAARAFVDALPLAALRPGTLVTDLVYAPRDTLLLREARAHGAQTLDGLAMLLHQGALAFELWTGIPAPIAAMRAALEAGFPAASG
jgi:shikimate dehydrogenase